MARVPGKQQSGDRAPESFAHLIDFHLKNGTRPKGRPGVLGTEWTNPDFAAAVALAEGTGERTVRNWRTGRTIPAEIALIEQALFGENPLYAAWRAELREVHSKARARPSGHGVPVSSRAKPIDLPHPPPAEAHEELIGQLSEKLSLTAGVRIDALCASQNLTPHVAALRKAAQHAYANDDLAEANRLLDEIDTEERRAHEVAEGFIRAIAKKVSKASLISAGSIKGALRNESEIAGEQNQANIKLEEFTAVAKLYADYAAGDRRVPMFRLSALLTQVLKRIPTDQEVDYGALAFAQLQEDFSRSLIGSQLNYIDHVKEINNGLYAIFGNELTKRNNIINFSNISTISWDGEIDPRSARFMKNAISRRGKKFRVNVSSISVAACSVIAWLILIGIEIELTTLDASGREQILGLRKLPDCDCIIVVDAPMLFEKHENVRFFLRRLDIHSERQVMLKKSGEERGRIPTIFMYPESSAEHQFRLSKEFNIGVPIPMVFQERFIELQDYKNLPQRMEAGDCVFAWNPLIGRLKQDKSIVEMPGSAFELTISMYQRSDWLSDDRESADAFIDLFVSVWKKAQSNQLLAWMILASTENYLNNVGRGVLKIPNPTLYEF